MHHRVKVTECFLADHIPVVVTPSSDDWVKIVDDLFLGGSGMGLEPVSNFLEFGSEFFYFFVKWIFKPTKSGLCSPPRFSYLW